ncbi:RidA family protein [Arthrobacter globiformis]|uniref:RidA family protein n=1 Tax=Arthrobacter globiformis TaxID=1665 RepID=UPI0027863063|nr:RidA family protein [Arthrobacter globiformis]MDQ0864544.1 enamine deaminase RidA (YjgF/YER057c/UK114 family) [Arthrobacter globiformis]
MTAFTKVKTGSKFETSVSYSRAFVVGDWIFVSNTAGIDYSTRLMPESAGEQIRFALKNVAGALGAVGATLADVVRAQVFVPNMDDLDEVLAVLGETFRGIDPALTTTCSPLAGAYKAEIEVTAFRGTAEAHVEQIDVTLG